MGFVVFIGFLIDAWKYPAFASRYDLYWHAYQVAYVLRHWPNSGWVYQVAAGMVLFRQYPPFSALLTALAVELSGISIGHVMAILSAAGLCAAALAIYGLALEITGDREVSVITSMMTMSAPGIWWTLFAGLYTRVLAAPFLPLSIWLTMKYLKGLRSGKLVRKWYLCATLALATATSLHPYVAFPAFLTIFLLAILALEEHRISCAIKLLIPALMLNSYFLLPYFTAPHPTAFYEPPVGLQFRVFWPSSQSDLALAPLYLPYIILLLAVTFRKRPFLFRLGTFQLRTLWTLILITFSFVLFSVLGYVYPEILGFTATTVLSHPETSLFLLPFFLMPLGGILLKRMFNALRGTKNVATAVLLLSILAFTALTTRTDAIAKIVSIPDYSYIEEEDSLRIWHQLEIDQNQTMFRAAVLGGTRTQMFMWLPYYGEVPVTTDSGFFLGQLNPKAWYDFHKNVYSNSSKLQTDFFLDWWAVKWLILVEPEYVKKFSRDYEPVVNISEKSISEYVYTNATPILSATNAPSMLVIGQEKSYDAVFQALAYRDWDSRLVIPVHANTYIDSYAPDELSKFTLIFLYGYDYHDRVMSWNLLENYVLNGGSLVIETGYSPDNNASSLPAPFPIDRTTWLDFGKEWRLATTNHSILEGVDLSAFSPPVYGVDPWAFSASLNESVRPWAQTVLWNHGHPLVVAGEYGKGRVVWLGMNLPWHIVSYSNSQESMLLCRALDWVSMVAERGRVSSSYDAERINPEKVLVNIQQIAKGVLYKEFYFKDWRAYLEENGKRTRELQIYKAGPDFMYVAIPQDATTPICVAFEFNKLIEYAGLALSVFTIVFLLGYGVIDQKRGFRPRGIGKIRETAKNWWYRE